MYKIIIVFFLNAPITKIPISVKYDSQNNGYTKDNIVFARIQTE